MNNKIITVESFTGTTCGDDRMLLASNEQSALSRAFGGKAEQWIKCDLKSGATHHATVRGQERTYWKRVK